jgi:FkbM family methyltransferase
MGSRVNLESAYALTERVLYWRMPRVYRALYSAYKALTDRPERALYARCIRPGMTVADVGANIGVNTALFADLVGPQGAVHAFEPEPENFARLRNALGDRANVTLMQAAVADASGERTLYLSPDLNVDHRLYDPGDGRRGVATRSIALDDHFPPEQPVGFVKIDIQGAECQALGGMRRVLAQPACRGVVFEYFPAGWQAAGGTWSLACELLVPLGYRLQGADGRPLSAGAPPPVGRTGYTNVAALRD